MTTPLPYVLEDDIEEVTNPDTETGLPSRRLGVRASATFGVVVSCGELRIRARAAQLSTTGVVIDFRHAEQLELGTLVTLDLMLPGLPHPIHTAARSVRSVLGKLQAFEFMIIGRDERLSIAEYLDRVQVERGA